MELAEKISVDKFYIQAAKYSFIRPQEMNCSYSWKVQQNYLNFQLQPVHIEGYGWQEL